MQQLLLGLGQLSEQSRLSPFDLVQIGRYVDAVAVIGAVREAVFVRSAAVIVADVVGVSFGVGHRKPLVRLVSDHLAEGLVEAARHVVDQAEGAVLFGKTTATTACEPGGIFGDALHRYCLHRT